MNRPFDLTKLDTERIRKQLRRKLVLLSLGPVVLVLLVSFKFLSISLLSTWGLHDYNKSDYPSASGDFKFLLFLNNFEKYKAPFNLGTSLYREGKYPEAQHRLEEALKYVPSEHECEVRLNLGMAIEVQADAKADQKKYDEAIVLYDEAKSVLTANNCVPKANSSSSQSNSNAQSNEQKVQNAKQRVEQKSQDTKRNRNGDKSNSQSSNSQQQQNDQQPSQSQTQKLEQKATQNQNLRQLRQRQDSINYDKNPGSYDRVVW